MGLRINNNIASLNAQRNLGRSQDDLGRSFERLSSGLRITRASDDVAGLAISERLRSRIRSLNQATRNANDGVSLVQTAEGALNEVSNILVRLRELAVQASSGTTSNDDKETLDIEFQSLVGEIDRIAQVTAFNGIALLDGSQGQVSIRVSDGVASIDSISVTLESIRTSDLTINALDIGSGGDTTTSITNIDQAINTVARIRGNLGAAQNRLESAILNVSNAANNLQAAEARIRDGAVAAETALLTRNNILQQAAIAILAQANAAPQSALALLRG
jgi:flagellin